jgi:hypothetical protein
LAEQGKVGERTGFKTLSDVEAGVVMEVLSYKISDTRNGDAVIATVIMPQHEKTRGETTLVLPIRFAEECERKVPCLLFYEGVKKLQGGKKCHDAKLVKLNDGVVFHDSDDEADDEASDDEGYEGSGAGSQKMSILDFVPTCSTCGETDELCLGRCDACDGHQPLNGGQCRCLIHE